MIYLFPHCVQLIRCIYMRNLVIQPPSEGENILMKRIRLIFSEFVSNWTDASCMRTLVVCTHSTFVWAKSFLIKTKKKESWICLRWRTNRWAAVQKVANMTRHRDSLRSMKSSCLLSGFERLFENWNFDSTRPRYLCTSTPHINHVLKYVCTSLDPHTFDWQQPLDSSEHRQKITLHAARFWGFGNLALLDFMRVWDFANCKEANRFTQSQEIDSLLPYSFHAVELSSTSQRKHKAADIPEHLHYPTQWYAT